MRDSVPLVILEDERIVCNEEQRSLDTLYLGEDGIGHQRHQLQLLRVWIACAARLVVHDVSRVAVDDYKVRDAPHPIVRAIKITRLLIAIERHLELGVLVAGHSKQRVNKLCEPCIVLNKRSAVPHVVFECCMYFLTVTDLLGLFDGKIPPDLDLVVLTRAIQELLQAAEGPLNSRHTTPRTWPHTPRVDLSPMQGAQT